jgi:hypothetical protein
VATRSTGARPGHSIVKDSPARSSAGLRLASLSLVFLALLFTPRLTWADTGVTADFDGDGRQDRVIVDQRAAAVRVWLSDSRRISTIGSISSAARLAARDLDGDRRDELLVAGGPNGLQVWTVRAAGRFALFPARPARASTLGTGGQVRDHDDADAGESVALASAAFACTRPPSRVAPPPPTAIALLERAAAVRSFLFSTKQGPRPPPALFA